MRPIITAIFIAVPLFLFFCTGNPVKPSVAPGIATQPQSQTVMDDGQNVTFSVTATGTAPLSYQWYKDDSLIPGATSPSYSISNVQAADSGTYTVTVSNGTAPNVTSRGASLTVNHGATLNDFIVTNQINGWTIVLYRGDSVFHFVDSTLFDLVGYANNEYCGNCSGSSALKAGTCFFLDTSSYGSAQIFVMDYGTPVRAKEQVNSMADRARATSLGTIVSIPSFPDTTAVGVDLGGEGRAYCHFGKFYFELYLTNFINVTSVPVGDIAMFLTYFQSKIN
jgi:hypothetical protein